MTDFTDEQNAAIADMIAAKVAEAVTTKNSEIAGLNRRVTELSNEKTQESTAKEDAERERIAASGSLEEVRERMKTLEGRLSERDKELQTIRFDDAIKTAVHSRNFRPEVREDLIDALRYRAKYSDGKTNVNGLTLDEYLEDFEKSDRGKFYIPANGSSGGGAMSVGKDVGAAKMTRENFNMTAFLALPKAERDMRAGELNMPHLRDLP